MRTQRGMQGLYPEQCGSGNVGLECARGPGHEYPLSRSLLSTTLLIQVLAWTSHQPMVLEQAWRLAGAIMQSILRSARHGIQPVWPEACSGVPGAIGPWGEMFQESEGSSESKIMDRAKVIDTAFNCQLVKNIFWRYLPFSTEIRGPTARGLEETPHISVSKSQASPAVFLHSSSSILVTRETFTQRETQNMIEDLLSSVVKICTENIST